MCIWLYEYAKRCLNQNYANYLPQYNPMIDFVVWWNSLLVSQCFLSCGFLCTRDLV